MKTKKKSKIKKGKEKLIKSKTEMILLIIFIILLILVFILGGLVWKAKKTNSKKVTANLVIAVLDFNKEHNFSLNVANLVNKKEYILKITNYRGDNVNQEEIPYTITLTNESKANVEVTKDESDQNLMVDQEATIIEDLKLKSGVKQDTYYYIKITGNDKVKSDDKINIKISSNNLDE